MKKTPITILSRLPNLRAVSFALRVPKHRLNALRRVCGISS